MITYHEYYNIAQYYQYSNAVIFMNSSKAERGAVLKYSSSRRDGGRTAGSRCHFTHTHTLPCSQSWPAVSQVSVYIIRARQTG